MAKRVQVLLEDDLDGGPADETVTFKLDGAEYEIDLSAKNAKKLRNAVQPYAEKARRVGRKTRTAGKRSNLGPSPEVLREWARQNGYEVSSRGRVPVKVQEAYAAAH